MLVQRLDLLRKLADDESLMARAFRQRSRDLLEPDRMLEEMRTLLAEASAADPTAAAAMRTLIANDDAAGIRPTRNAGATFTGSVDYAKARAARAKQAC